MSLNSAMMSLASGSSSAIAGFIISQPNEHSPLEHYPIVGYVACTATLGALVIVRMLRDMAIEREE
jgi:predicted MFS family arabinose efflux permease